MDCKHSAEFAIDILKGVKNAPGKMPEGIVQRIIEIIQDLEQQLHAANAKILSLEKQNNDLFPYYQDHCEGALIPATEYQQYKFQLATANSRIAELEAVNKDLSEYAAGQEELEAMMLQKLMTSGECLSNLESTIESLTVSSKCTDCDHVERIAKLERVVDVARIVADCRSGINLKPYAHSHALDAMEKALAELEASK